MGNNIIKRIFVVRKNNNCYVTYFEKSNVKMKGKQKMEREIFLGITVHDYIII